MICIAVVIITYVLLTIGWIHIGPTAQPHLQYESQKTNSADETLVSQQSEITPSTSAGEKSVDQYYAVSVDIQCTATHKGDNGAYSRGTLYGTVPLSVMINPDNPAAGQGANDDVTITNYKAETFIPCTSSDEEGGKVDCSCRWTYDGPASASILMNSSPAGGIGNWKMALQFLNDDIDIDLVNQDLPDCSLDLDGDDATAQVIGPLSACSSGADPFSFTFSSGSVIQLRDTIGRGADSYQRDLVYIVNITPEQ